MVDTTTTIYQFTQPEVGGSDDTWGDKLNANWAKIDGLLQSASLTETGFYGATLTNLGTGLRIVGGSSILEFRESDIALPGGTYRWQANAGQVRLVANTAAAGDFSTSVEMMAANSAALSIKVPISDPVTFSGGPAIAMTNNTPQIQWMEGDQTGPVGQYRMYVQSDNFYFQRALTADFATSTTLFNAAGSFFNVAVDLTFSTVIRSGSTTFPGDATVSGMNLQSDSFNIKPRSGLAGSGACIVQSWNGAATFQTLRSGAVQNSTGVISVISDAATKTDVVDATPKLADLNRLRVVNYTSTLQPDAGKLLGFVAQEVQEVFPSLVEANVIEDEDGNVTGEGPLAVKWSILVPALVKAVQELTDRLETLEGGGSRARA